MGLIAEYTPCDVCEGNKRHYGWPERLEATGVTGRFNGYYLRHDKKKSEHFKWCYRRPYARRRIYTAEHDPNVHITVYDNSQQPRMWQIDIVNPDHPKHTVNVPDEINCGCLYYTPRHAGLTHSWTWWKFYVQNSK